MMIKMTQYMTMFKKKQKQRKDYKKIFIKNNIIMKPIFRNCTNKFYKMKIKLMIKEAISP